MALVKRIFANGIQSIYGWIAGLMSVLSPSTYLIATTFLFIFIDCFYGYKVSKKFGHKEFESSKFWNTVEKLCFAAIMICAFTLLDKFIFDTYVNLIFAKIAAGSICFAEIISILEAQKALKPKSLVVRILNKVIKSKAEKYLEVDISDIIDENNENNSNNTKPTLS